MIKLSGMWVHTSKDGSIRVTGNMGSCRLVMLPNKFKSRPTDSDYTLYVAEQDKPSIAPLPTTLPSGDMVPDEVEKPVTVLEDNDVPF